ncbi:hypothetical protein [Noviherbaspirillum album]|uniref:hypothetical protein n=1 Tax=Noviherbaspirillum album TaxID=3080276 RepID=UPI002DD6BA26|nr:hypothetical protein [Noviherbaspirillum sp. CPCC 100848]
MTKTVQKLIGKTLMAGNKQEESVIKICALEGRIANPNFDIMAERKSRLRK